MPNIQKDTNKLDDWELQRAIANIFQLILYIKRKPMLKVKNMLKFLIDPNLKRNILQNTYSLSPRQRCAAAQFAIKVLRIRIFSTEQSLIVLRTTKKKPNSIVNFTRLPQVYYIWWTRPKIPSWNAQRHHLTKFIPSFSRFFIHYNAEFHLIRRHTSTLKVRVFFFFIPIYKCI